jgi:hypothetical protein
MCDFGTLNILSKKLDIFFKNPLTLSIIRDIIETSKQKRPGNRPKPRDAQTLRQTAQNAIRKYIIPRIAAAVKP